jgi:hypothetical protein
MATNLTPEIYRSLALDEYMAFLDVIKERNRER